MAANSGSKYDGGEGFYWLIGLVAPLLVIVMWLVMMFFYLQSPVVNLRDFDASIEEMATAPDLFLDDFPDETEP